MSRIIWTSGVGCENLEHDAAETLHQIGCALDSLTRDRDVRGSPGLLDTMMAHWQVNHCNLSLAMNSLSTSDALESVFSFQPDHVQVFVNTEGAYPEDVSVVVLPGEGGFDLTVRHKDVRWGTEARSCAQRQVTRNYRFLRPLDWIKAEYGLGDDGVFQLIVPGPRPALQQLPFQHLHCTTDRSELFRVGRKKEDILQVYEPSSTSPSSSHPFTKYIAPRTTTITIDRRGKKSILQVYLSGPHKLFQQLSFQLKHCITN